MTKKVLIKKYANRRLYNTDKSKYITLNQVSDLIREGNVVRVVDAKTGEDVTAFILTQIIVEEAKTKNILLPAPLLHVIIQYGDNILKEFFDKYLMKTIDNYLIYKNEMDTQFRKWLDLSTDLSSKAREAMESLSPFKSPFTGFSPPTDKDSKDENETK
jgi:polyhydroxyalkanoate synthesis repressor PhaR